MTNPNLPALFDIPIGMGKLYIGDLDVVLADGDPKIPLDRICDLNNSLAVAAENERRAMRAARSQR